MDLTAKRSAVRNFSNETNHRPIKKIFRLAEIEHFFSRKQTIVQQHTPKRHCCIFPSPNRIWRKNKGSESRNSVFEAEARGPCVRAYC